MPPTTTPPTTTPAVLVLEDGRTFTGEAFGARGEAFGEAVFATPMTGYQETLTDPSYHGQIVVSTAPHVGNTGWNDEDDESTRIWARGHVVRDLSRVSSNWRSRRSLDAALTEAGVPGITGIDTRALTRHLRDHGSMRAGLSTVGTDPTVLLARVREQPAMAGLHLVDDVTTPETRVVPAEGSPRFRVAAIDLGIKSMTPRQLARRGVEVHVVPATTTFDELVALGVDGVFFSNGPGDPSTMDAAVTLVRRTLDAGVPFFGICFGNQVFGRALGFETYKLRFGHRGINQPVRDTATGKVEITAQNHGFAVRAPLEGSVETPWGRASVSHIGLNDSVVEGLRLVDAEGRLRAFSVQYHPEAAAGPHDSAHLFDRFVSILEGAA